MPEARLYTGNQNLLIKMPNPNKDDLHRIKKWVAKQETQEEIPGKSKDRVYGDIAKGIRQIKKTPQGACQLCSRISDRLVPVSLKVCKRCAGKFNKRGSEFIRFLKREFILAYCEACLGKTFVLYHINPFVCIKCSTKIGRGHQFDKKEADKINLKAPWRNRWRNQRVKIRK